MKRKSYDRWGIEITSFNRNITFYVEIAIAGASKECLSKKLL